MIEIGGQVYDGIMDKPTIDEFIEHRDHKYLSKYKGPSGKWIYKYKSKIQELRARINRKRLGLKPDQIWDSKDPTYGDFDNPVRYDKGKANSRSGQTGSKNVKTTKVNYKKKKKK